MKKDYDRLGINELKKLFYVKILDFTVWINPTVWDLQSNQVYRCDERIVINSKKDFLTFLSKANPIIFIDYLTLGKKEHWIRQQLKKKDGLFVDVVPGDIPVPETNFVQQLKGLFFLLRRSKNFFYSVFKILEERYYLSKKSVSNISIVGSLFALKSSKAKKKIHAHCWNYDTYLTTKNKQANNTVPYAVFLDEDMVYHSDVIIRGIVPPVNKNEYYPLLLKFLKKFETETGLLVNFAVHPKASSRTLKNLSNLLPGIKCSTDNTAELVKNSELVLLHGSTSFSFVVLFKKPAIFLTSNEIKKSPLNNWIKKLAKEVNGKVINMSNELNAPLNIKIFLKIDEDKYKYYLNKYIKIPNSPDLPLWKIFTNYILDEKIQN